MGVHDETEDGFAGLSAEEKLSILARTPKWEFPEEFIRFRETLSGSMDVLDRTRGVLSDSEVFDCGAREKALLCSEKIAQAVQKTGLEQQLGKLHDYIDRCNTAIDEAQNVWLPGDRLDAESERTIMDATEPLDMVVPGLGTVTGVMGIEGANLVSKLLSGNREDRAKEEYEKIMRRVGEQVKPDPVDIEGTADINGTWPDNSAEPHDDEDDRPHTTGGTGGGLPDTMTGVGAGAVAGLAARNAVAGSGAGPLSAYTGGMRTDASHDSPGTGDGHGGEGGAGRPRQSRSSTPESDGSGRSSYPDGMVYDPSTGAWIHKKDAMSVDGGMDGLNGAGVNGAGVVNGAGRTVLAAGAGAGLGAGGTLAAGRLMASGSSMGALGAMSGAGGAGMASISGAGIGSYYANEPVKATPVSSSIKGATGLAAGLRRGASASSAGVAASHGASPAMMGAGRGGSSGSGGKRRNTLGYIAPKIEDDEEFVPKPLAAMAGRRKRPGE